MTAEELRSIIAAGLPCDHLEVDGDGPGISVPNGAAQERVDCTCSARSLE